MFMTGIGDRRTRNVRSHHRPHLRSLARGTAVCPVVFFASCELPDDRRELDLTSLETGSHEANREVRTKCCNAEKC